MSDSTEQDPATRTAIGALDALVYAMSTYINNVTNTVGEAKDLANNAVKEDQLHKVVQFMANLSNFHSSLDPVLYTGYPVQFTPTGVTTSAGTEISYLVKSTDNCTLDRTTWSQGESVTITPPETPGGEATIVMVAVANGVQSSDIVLTVDVRESIASKPQVLTPLNNATGVNEATAYTCSAYQTIPANFNTHTKTQWRLVDADDNVVFDAESSTTLTEYVTTEELRGEQTHRITVRQYGDRMGWTEWSDPTTFTTRQVGGLGFVYLRDDGEVEGIGGPVIDGYQIIVAPARDRTKVVKWGLFGIDTVTDNVTGDVDAQSGYEMSRLLMENHATDYDSYDNVGPVALLKAVTELGPEWFIPNMTELQEIVKNREAIDQADKTTGVKLKAMRRISIWCSSEYEADNQHMVKGNGKGTGITSKNSGRGYVPCKRIKI